MGFSCPVNQPWSIGREDNLRSPSSRSRTSLNSTRFFLRFPVSAPSLEKNTSASRNNPSPLKHGFVRRVPDCPSCTPSRQRRPTSELRPSPSKSNRGVFARPYSVFATTPQTGRSRSDFSRSGGSHDHPQRSLLVGDDDTMGFPKSDLTQKSRPWTARTGRSIAPHFAMRDIRSPAWFFADLMANFIFLPTAAMMKSRTLGPATQLLSRPRQGRAHLRSRLARSMSRVGFHGMS